MTRFVKFKMSAILINEFSTPMYIEMLMTIKESQSKSEVEFRYGSCVTDSKFYTTYF